MPSALKSAFKSIGIYDFGIIPMKAVWRDVKICIGIEHLPSIPMHETNMVRSTDARRSSETKLSANSDAPGGLFVPADFIAPAGLIAPGGLLMSVGRCQSAKCSLANSMSCTTSRVPR